MQKPLIKGSFNQTWQVCFAHQVSTCNTSKSFHRHIRQLAGILVNVSNLWLVSSNNGAGSFYFPTSGGTSPWDRLFAQKTVLSFSEWQLDTECFKKILLDSFIWTVDHFTSCAIRSVFIRTNRCWLLPCFSVVTELFGERISLGHQLKRMTCGNKIS